MIDEPAKSRVARWIAGDITLSDKPGNALKLWRDRFEMSQTALADALKISPSVISDYEAGRRKSPGVITVKRIVEAMIEGDIKVGGKVTRAYSSMFGSQLPPDVLLDMREFEKPIDGKTLCKAIDGEAVANKDLLDKRLFGYTVIDGPKAVLMLSAEEFMHLYGMTTERALVFTGVTTGRSPMIAIKVKGITPGVVVIHGEIKEVDPLGVKIAEILRVPLIVSKITAVNELIEKLKKCAP
jgi:putative transcriptional regulator